MDQQHPPKKTKKRSPELSLRGRALRLLGRREFSRQELDKKLRPYVDADHPDELNAVLDDLAERGWLSDARYADALVRKHTGQYARRSIAQKLKQAGINEDVTAAALAQHVESDPDEEFFAALALCQRKFRRAPVDQKEKARQIRFLQSRGYSIGLALRVLKQAEGKDSSE
ncbi:MAG: recombination regulator RecX [Burkholderiales bacterium]